LENEFYFVSCDLLKTFFGGIRESLFSLCVKMLMAFSFSHLVSETG